MNNIINTFWDAVDKQMSLFSPNPIVFAVLILFVLYGGYHDIKTYKITNKFNKIFFLTGFVLMVAGSLVDFLGVKNQFLQGIDFSMNHIYGAVLGFLILFIPGMILNHAFGGDIKFITVIGFWIGVEPMFFVLLVFLVTQFIYWFGAFYIWKEFGKKKIVAFGPFFAIGVIVLIIMSYLL